ncbi:type II toxin-antitoxin system HicB family antitoxin [Archaeoglobus sp.]
MAKLMLTVIIWKEGDKYVSKCPELEIASCGDSVESALENLKEAVELYLENAKELGLIEEIPEFAFEKKLVSVFEITI